MGELRGSEGDEGVEGAQAILDAADATLPTGDLADGAYDALGAFYGVPQWVVRDPEGVEEGEEEEEEGETERRREEKGKGVLEGGGVKVKARLSERGGRDVVVVLGRGESVRVLARRVEVDGQVCVLFLVPIPGFSMLMSLPSFHLQSTCASRTWARS